jgi:UDP-GlcNAc:undecaprenyl-phosphate GlcNAc-1-phosphate transferase
MTYSIAQFFLLGLLTLVFVGLITAPIRNLALRVGAVDAPTLARKAQKEPIPYLGGVAIAVGIVGASYASLLAVDFSWEMLRLASFVLIPAVAISEDTLCTCNISHDCGKSSPTANNANKLNVSE